MKTTPDGLLPEMSDAEVIDKGRRWMADLLAIGVPHMQRDLPGERCGHCEKEMAPGGACTALTVEYPDGETLPALPYHGEIDCHDCSVRPGANHHPGCDMERCPRCSDQLLSCGCLDAVEAGLWPVAALRALEG